MTTKERRGGNTLTNEDAIYHYRKSFKYVDKGKNDVQQLGSNPDSFILDWRRGQRHAWLRIRIVVLRSPPP
jgi:hypothetical protein